MANVLNKPIIIIGSGGSEHLVECENLPETIDKSKVYRVSREITLGEFNDIYLCAPALKDIFGKETFSFREFMTLDGAPTHVLNYILVDSLPDYESFVNGEVTVYDKISNKTIDATMLNKQLMNVFISEETSDAYMLTNSFASMSEEFGSQFAGEPLPCKGVVTSVSEITKTGLYLMYYAGDRHIAYRKHVASGVTNVPYPLDNAILGEFGVAGGYSDVPFFTEPVMDHILFDSTQATDEGFYDLATGHFRAYSTTTGDGVPTVIAIDINDYSAYVNTAYSELSRIDDMFGYESKGVVNSLDEMTEDGYYILKRNNSTSTEGSGKFKSSIHVPYSGEYTDVTVECPEGTIISAYSPENIAIMSSDENQTVYRSDGKYINEVTIEYGTKSDRTDFSYFFKESKATEIRLIDTSNATNMKNMFYHCSDLTTIPLLDTRNVTDMNGMFYGCRALTTIPLLNTSNVTNMRDMFKNCTNLTTIPLLDTSNVTDMWNMFYGCNKLTTIPLLNISNVPSMYCVFENCYGLTTMPLLDTSKVTDMGSMFKNCTNLTTIPLLDTSNVTSMGYMFNGCKSLTTVPLLSTSNVTGMYGMFKGCTNLTTIPELDTSNVTSMDSMFSNCTNLTTIPLLDTSKVTNMSGMFSGCTNLTTIPLLDTSNITNMSGMFDGCRALTTIPLLNTSNVTNMRDMFGECTNLTIPELDTSKVTNMSGMFSGCTNLTTIPLLDTSKVADMSNMFDDCNKLTTIPLLDTSKVTNMNGMFDGCKALTTIPQLDTSWVTKMSAMFRHCTITTIPELDTSNVTSMVSMFYECTNLTTIPALDVSNVTNMDSMFYKCSSLKSILMTGMKVSFDISASTQFERSDLVTILNNLARVTKRTTLTMGTTNLKKLSNTNKAIATNKGWTLA